MTTVLHIDGMREEISLMDADTGQTLKTWKIKDTDNTWSERYAMQFEVEEVAE